MRGGGLISYVVAAVIVLGAILVLHERGRSEEKDRHEVIKTAQEAAENVATQRNDAQLERDRIQREGQAEILEFVRQGERFTLKRGQALEDRVDSLEGEVEALMAQDSP